ncbi:hypothetical protein TRSC58_03796 [Trypanosoma rangeli SC58]|uniref:Uncharacterized protein n=1 Tax=Trypanosoma rangeli SC58 TaxID=429131 RepID=A0A061J314_TRYRA|nr:hypothetical protein TRSC58_03796 [Trypanosoma rangeli SC58]
MNAEAGADEATAKLVSRLAQRSTLSSDAKPFIPSFLQAPATTAELQQTNGEVGNAVEWKQDELLRSGLEELYRNSDTYVQLPSVGSLATTAAVASTALHTFGDMTEEQLQQLEEYLWDPSQENGAAEDDERVFVNDDDGMDVAEEEWLLNQMLEAAEATQSEEIHKNKTGNP